MTKIERIVDVDPFQQYPESEKVVRKIIEHDILDSVWFTILRKYPEYQVTSTGNQVELPRNHDLKIQLNSSKTHPLPTAITSLVQSEVHNLAVYIDFGHKLTAISGNTTLPINSIPLFNGTETYVENNPTNKENPTQTFQILPASYSILLSHIFYDDHIHDNQDNKENIQDGMINGSIVDGSTASGNKKPTRDNSKLLLRGRVFTLMLEQHVEVLTPEMQANIQKKAQGKKNAAGAGNDWKPNRRLKYHYQIIDIYSTRSHSEVYMKRVHTWKVDCEDILQQKYLSTIINPYVNNGTSSINIDNDDEYIPIAERSNHLLFDRLEIFLDVFRCQLSNDGSNLIIVTNYNILENYISSNNNSSSNTNTAGSKKGANCQLLELHPAQLSMDNFIQEESHQDLLHEHEEITTTPPIVASATSEKQDEIKYLPTTVIQWKIETQLNYSPAVTVQSIQFLSPVSNASTAAPTTTTNNNNNNNNNNAPVSAAPPTSATTAYVPLQPNKYPTLRLLLLYTRSPFLSVFTIRPKPTPVDPVNTGKKESKPPAGKKDTQASQEPVMPVYPADIHESVRLTLSHAVTSYQLVSLPLESPARYLTGQQVIEPEGVINDLMVIGQMDGVVSLWNITIQSLIGVLGKHQCAISAIDALLIHNTNDSKKFALHIAVGAVDGSWTYYTQPVAMNTNETATLTNLPANLLLGAGKVTAQLQMIRQARRQSTENHQTTPSFLPITNNKKTITTKQLQQIRLLDFRHDLVRDGIVSIRFIQMSTASESNDGLFVVVQHSSDRIIMYQINNNNNDNSNTISAGVIHILGTLSTVERIQFTDRSSIFAKMTHLPTTSFLPLPDPKPEPAAAENTSKPAAGKAGKKSKEELEAEAEKARLEEEALRQRQQLEADAIERKLLMLKKVKLTTTYSDLLSITTNDQSDRQNTLEEQLKNGKDFQRRFKIFSYYQTKQPSNSSSNNNSSDNFTPSLFIFSERDGKEFLFHEFSLGSILRDYRRKKHTVNSEVDDGILLRTSLPTLPQQQQQLNSKQENENHLMSTNNNNNNKHHPTNTNFLRRSSKLKDIIHDQKALKLTEERLVAHQMQLENIQADQNHTNAISRSPPVASRLNTGVPTPQESSQDPIDPEIAIREELWKSKRQRQLRKQQFQKAMNILTNICQSY